jgi:hypothetical protein
LSARPKVTLCVPVWGRGHVATWLDHVLPSWFAAGNLPALAAACDLSVVLLTRSSDAPVIAAHPAGERLARDYGAAVRPIDDLVTGTMSAVTLTLAFVRGARIAQERGADAVAAYLNADFILADGALASLAAALPDADIVLAPSLRGDSDAVLAALPATGSDGALALASPDLAALALAHLHATARACFVDQQQITSDGGYEFYHHAGPGLVLCRSLQLFPLAVRPGPGPLVAEAFCDYGLFDLWTPGARTVTLADSDGWFALELGDPGQQANFIRPGPHDPAAIAAGIARWSTAPQRAQAETLVTIRTAASGAPPDPGALALLDRFMAAATSSLPPPLPIRQHPYWRTGLRRWREAAEAARLSPPPELAGWSEAPQGRGERLREAFRSLFYGRPGARRPWQIDARLERDLSDLRDAAIDDDGLWLARRAGLIGKVPGGDHRVVCAPAVDPAALASLPAGLRRLDLVLTGCGPADLPPDWEVIAVRPVGRRADERRRADLEQLGRLVWARDWGGLARLAPRILAGAATSAFSVWAALPERGGEGQALRITAIRR